MNLTPSAGRLDDDSDPDAIIFIQGSAIDGGGDRTRKSVGLEFAVPVTNKLNLTWLQDMTNMMMLHLMLVQEDLI